MRLQSISVSGALKGRAFTESLTGCDIWAGPNGSGKTSRLLAVSAGLRGLRESAPGAASVEKGKLTLQSGEYLGPGKTEAVVSLDYDAGSLTRDLGAMRGKERIRADLAADALVGPAGIRYDLSDFERASDATRTAILRGCLGVASWTWEQMESWLREHCPGPALEGLVIAAPHQPADVSLPAAAAWLAEKVSEKQAQKRAADLSVTEAEGRQKEAEEARGRLPALAERNRVLDKNISEGEASIAQAAGRAALHQQRAREGQRLVDSVVASEKAASAAMEGGKTAARALSAHPARPDRTEELARVAVEASRIEQEDAEDLETARKLLDRHRETLSRARGTLDALRPLVASASSSCRSCGAEDPLGISARLDASSMEVERLEEIDQDLAMDVRLSDRAFVAAKAAAYVAADALALERAGVDKDARALAALQSAVERARDEVERTKKAAQDAEVAAQAVREDWESLPTVGLDLETSRALLATWMQEREDIRTERDKLAQAQGLEAEMQKAIARREQIGQQLEAARALQSSLRDLQAEIARATYAPILEYARSLCPPDLQPYMDSESDWGATVRGVRVHFSAMSDGERALVGAAFVAAFVRLSGAKWRGLLLDRLEAIDPARLDAFLLAVSREVQEGRLDNFLGALRADAPPTLPDGVAARWLGGPDAR